MARNISLRVVCVLNTVPRGMGTDRACVDGILRPLQINYVTNESNQDKQLAVVRGKFCSHGFGEGGSGGFPHCNPLHCSIAVQCPHVLTRSGRLTFTDRDAAVDAS
ncbi:hypothetical protein AC1031_000449 [Aphanomyces cochlioides]|nr:hypothetical protein AC1031_000449 [Aphanomyces cochlioides]